MHLHETISPGLASVTGINVAMVVDRPVVGDAIAAALREDCDLHFVATATDEASGRTLIQDPDIHVLLVILNLVEPGGCRPAIDFVRYAKSVRPDLHILLLKRQMEEHLVRAALDAGADGCCLATVTPQRLILAIKSIVDGSAYLDPTISKVILHKHADAGKAAHDFHLSERERIVLRLVSEGLTNDQIAAELCCTAATVKTHVLHLFRKLGVENRVSAAMLALRSGLV